MPRKPKPKTIKEAENNITPLHGCVCETFWNPNEYGEVVEYEGEHWHFRSDVQFDDGSIHPGLIRQIGGYAERKKQGVSFKREDIKWITRNG